MLLYPHPLLAGPTHTPHLIWLAPTFEFTFASRNQRVTRVVRRTPGWVGENPVINRSAGKQLQLLQPQQFAASVFYCSLRIWLTRTDTRPSPSTPTYTSHFRPMKPSRQAHQSHPTAPPLTRHSSVPCSRAGRHHTWVTCRYPGNMWDWIWQ